MFQKRYNVSLEWHDSFTVFFYPIQMKQVQAIEGT